MGEMYIFSNLIGSFVLDSNLKIKDQVFFKNINDYLDMAKTEEKLVKKHGNIKKPEKTELKKILQLFSDKKYYKDFYEKNIILTKLNIKNSVKPDLLILHAVNSIKETDKALNILSKKLRDWHSLYNPEISKEIEDHQKFCELIIQKDRKELLKEISKEEASSMGADIAKEDLDVIFDLAQNIYDLFLFRKKNEEYLEKKMNNVCPNIQAVAGTLIGAKLIELAGSLEKLVKFPASTLQLLGAENALFRHIRNKKIRPPKYGILHEHPLIQKNMMKDHGKIARALADKISIAAKIDFFKGKFIGDKLKEEIEEKFGNMKK